MKHAAHSGTGFGHSRSLARALREALPLDCIVEDPDILQSYRRDQAGEVPAGQPAVAILPSTTEQVMATMSVASSLGVPVVPRGAGSGLSGGANAVDGAIMLSLHRMDAILGIDEVNLTATVQPGVINGELSARVRKSGLYYPPDPASADFCTVGGNIATNAGGLCCVKYGVTRDYVLGVEAVLASGARLRTGRRTPKGVSGYDITSLLVGSEGTLAVVTEATLRLVPEPPAPATVVAFFPSLHTAGEAVRAVAAAGIAPSMMELMDQVTVKAVEAESRMGLDTDAAALLIAQSDAGGDASALARRMGDCCEESGATFVAVTDDPEEIRQLTVARQLAYPSLEAQGATLLDDVAVPRDRVPNLIAGIQQIASVRGVTIGTFGHVGEGNMHPTIVFDATCGDSRTRAARAFDDLLSLTLELGGTLTGEHGVGLLKRSRLPDEVGVEGMAIMHAVKAAFDPRGILNPGKVLAQPPSRS